MTGDDSAETARSLLIEGFGELRLAITDHQLDTLVELALLLGQWSTRTNLTGHRTPPEIARRHYIQLLPEEMTADVEF